MTAGIFILVGYVALIWLVFFKLKLLKFSIGWEIISGFVGLPVPAIFLIGIRFVVPYSTSATVVQPTIQPARTHSCHRSVG